MSITAKEVNELRQLTGSGMMDCKKALVEANGDIQAAIDYLRKKGAKVAELRAGRESNEGAVIALTSADGKEGVVVRISCETDFVAKNDGFVALATEFAQAALKHLPNNIDELNALPYGDITIAEKVAEQTGVIGEKIEISQYDKIVTAAGEGQVIPYIHMGNRAAVIVALNQEGPNLVDAGKNVTMQIAAMQPVAVDKSSVPQSVIEKELEIAKEIARNEGKPEAMLDKIAQGRLSKFFQESTLLEQKYVKDNSVTVAQYLDSVQKGLTVTAFYRVALG